MKNKIIDIIQLIVGFLIMLAPKYIAPVCPYDASSGEKPMKCFHMGNAVTTIGMALVVILVINILIKNDAIKLGIQIGIALLSGSAIYVSKWGIGGCMHAHMSCQMKTIPTVMILGCIMIALSCFYIFKNMDKFKES